MKYGLTILLVIILVPLFLIVGTWLLMITWGAVASIFGWPTISFWQAAVMYAFLSVIGGFFRGSK